MTASASKEKAGPSRLAGHARILHAGGPTQPRQATTDGWFVSCLCGWNGGQHELKADATAAYTKHKASALPICRICRIATQAADMAPRSGICKWCRTVKTQAFAEANPSTWEEYKRRYHLLKRYGITPQQFDEILHAQDGVCAICLEPPRDPRGFRMHVDHDHASGAVRGILCSACNQGLGSLRDDVANLRRAIRYLQTASRRVEKLCAR